MFLITWLQNDKNNYFELDLIHQCYETGMWDNIHILPMIGLNQILIGKLREQQVKCKSDHTQILQKPLLLFDKQVYLKFSTVINLRLVLF